MRREEKVKEVAFLSDKLGKATCAFLASFQGMKVESVNELRKRLKEHTDMVKVVKNTLAKRAVSGTDLEVLSESFKGATALIIPTEDPVMPAKVLVDFKKQDQALKLKKGFLKGKVLEAADLEELAKVPSREILLARLAGSLKSPITRLVYALSDNYGRLVRVLGAIAEKKEKEGN